MGYLFDPDNWEWLTTGNNARFVFEGFLVNVQIALIAMVFSLIVGLALALRGWRRNRAVAARGRHLDRRLAQRAAAAADPLRLPRDAAVLEGGLRELGAGLPVRGAAGRRRLRRPIALVLYNSAVLAEIMRAGIQSLDRGQNEAAVALGLTYWQRMRIVILPQGLRRMLPATVSQLITLNKDTTLVSIIAIQEVMRHGRILTGQNFFGGVQAPILQVFLFIGAAVHRHEPRLSRLSRRLEIREQKRTGTTVKPVTGLEDQVVTVRAR